MLPYAESSATSCAGYSSSTMPRLVSIGLSLLLLVSLATRSAAFNLAVNSSQHVAPTGDAFSQSHFGYSVAFKRDQDKIYLVVGAPNALVSVTSTARLAGVTYRVLVGADSLAQPLPIRFDNQATRPSAQRTNYSTPPERRLGAVIATPSLGRDGTILSCAPNYRYNSLNNSRAPLRHPIGACYMMRNARVTPFMPCESDVATRQSQCSAQSSASSCASRSYVESLGFCQAGFSASFAPDGQALVIGAPGAEGWHGALFGYSITNSGAGRQSSTYDPTRNGQYHSRRDFQYLGYSVAFGELNGDSNLVEVVASAPRYSDVSLRGLVYVFERLIQAQSLYQIGREIDPEYPLFGQQSGAYFGYKVLSFDINGDKLDDIIVSAPMFTDYPNHMHEVGRVYVFLQTREARASLRFDRTMMHVIDPPHPRNRARFGHAIANAGDINDDGYLDLLVGEPYGGADGNGEVHLYAYIDRKVDDKPVGIRWLQTISAAEVGRIANRPLRSFGFSIAANFSSNPHDNTPDVLIGAPFSATVVYIRTSPVAHIITKFKTKSSEDFVVEPDTTVCGDIRGCFELQICSILNRNEVTSVQVTMTLTVDATMAHNEKRVKLTQSSTASDSELYEKQYPLTLTAESLTCQEMPVFFKSQVIDRRKNIFMTVEYNLREMQLASPRAVPVVIDRFDQNTSVEIFIPKGCREMKQCLADFAIDVRSVTSVYLVDSIAPIEVEVTIQNRGDAAGNTRMRIAIPIGVRYQGVAVLQSDANAPSCSPQDAETDKRGANYPDNVVICAFGEFPGMRVANGSERAATQKLKFSFSAAYYDAALNRANMASRISRIQELVAEADDDYDAQPQFSSDSLLFEFNLTSETDEKYNDYRNNYDFTSVKMKADLQIVLHGSSQPEQLLLNVSATQQQKVNITNAKQLEGFEVSHKYEVVNVGKTRVAEVELVIRWPGKLGDQHLLYLSQQPTVIRGDGSCKLSEPIDPLRLFRSDKAKRQALKNDTDKFEASQRLKRASGSFFGMNIDSGTRDNLELTCSNSKCHEIRCRITNMTDNAIIEVTGFAWWTTILMVSAKEVTVTSDAVAKILRLSTIPDLSEANFSSATSKAGAKTAIIVPYDTEIVRVPLWAIILAVILGVLLLLIVIIVLIMCGFFKRQRPPMAADQQQAQADVLGRVGDTDNGLIPNTYATQAGGRPNLMYAPYDSSQMNYAGPGGQYYSPVPQALHPDDLAAMQHRSNALRKGEMEHYGMVYSNGATGRALNSAESPRSPAAFSYTELNEYNRPVRNRNDASGNAGLDSARMQF